MTSIDSREASEALSDIIDIVRRVRQSTIYNLASLMLILWGVLVFAGNIASFPGRSTAPISGSASMRGRRGLVRDQRLRLPATGIRTFDFRMLVAVLLFIAFGIFSSCWLGHFTPRQMGTFWTIYFMLFYTIVGLWFGLAFVVIGLGVTVLTLVGYFFVGGGSCLDGRGQRRRPRSGRPLDAPELSMAELDDVIHQPLRLKIMAALNALPAAAGLEFSRLKKLTGATDGNLGAHIETLSKAGYVAVDKAFVGKKPQTTVTATAAGRGAFARHVATLQEIIAASAREP